MTALEHHAGRLIVVCERLAHENEILRRTEKAEQRRMVELIEDLRQAEAKVRLLEAQLRAAEQERRAA